MADEDDVLSFGIGADFSGLTRAADGAGRTLDALGRRIAAWAGDAAEDLRAPFAEAAAAPATLGAAMTAARGALRGGRGGPLAPGTGPAPVPTVTPQPAFTAPTGGQGEDDTASRELARLADQLALLRSTGAAHEAIAAQMRVEAEQAKLGTDATEAQKQAVAGLVTQIDAAKAAQTALKGEQAATDAAWRAGSTTIAGGIEAMILDGARLNDVLRSTLASFARQGLGAALTGAGPLAGLFGTAGQSGQVGGLFGALERLASGSFGGSTSGSLLGGLFGGGAGPAAASVDASFAGLYAAGGTLAAGQWGIAGEKGAEVVAGPATVVPLGRMAAPARAAPASATHQTITFNVTSPDAPSFARSEGQMASLLSRLVARGQRNG